MSTATMPQLVARYVLPAAWELLPAQMQSDRAAALLLAIGLQESRFLHRRQIRGPATSFWQFEKGGGVQGVLTHPTTAAHALDALTRLRYMETSAETVYRAMEHSDVLACVFARLLLWTLPDSLPDRDEPDRGWDQYMSAWRPGKPHPQTWADCYAAGWALVGAKTDVSGHSTQVA